jgi:hypothetical protein
MPRVRKVPPPAVQMQPGSNTQLPSAPTGMPYGERGASIAAQEQLPIGTGSDMGPADPMERMAQMAPDFDSVPNINDPTDFPDEPITAGLSLGPGPGPGSVGPATAGRVTSTLDQVALLSGDPKLRALAEIARAQGI